MESRVNITISVVNDLKIRSRKENEILGVCPVCGCNDANFNLSKLVWRCWHCVAKGAIMTEKGYEVREIEQPKFDIPEIRKIYSSLANKYHNNLFSEAINYLKGRGLTDDTINKFKLGFCGDDFYDEYTNKNAEDSGVIYQNYPILYRRVVIPYTYKDEVVDLRGRILDSVYSYKEGTPSYISLSGSHESRGANFLFNHDILDKENTVIITEGEFKAIVANQYGFPVVATPGIFGWNKKWSDRFKDKEVILAADNDKMSGLRSPAYLMAKMLVKDIPQLKVAVLYKTSKQDKVDIDSIIINKGIKAFENSIKGAMDTMKWLHLEERKGYGRRK